MKTDLQEKIIRVLTESKRKLSSRELYRRSGIRSKESFYHHLDALKQAGKVSVNKKHMVFLEESGERVPAEIISLSKGFAFARTLHERKDYFIHADRLKGAMVGDRVVLKNLRDSERGPSAEVGKIETRKNRSTTGTVVKLAGGYEIKPDSAIRYNIPVDKKDAKKLKNGDKVQIGLYRKKDRDKLFAKVTKVYGKANSAKVCADAIIDQNGIPHVFSQEALEEAGIIAGCQVTAEDLKGRLDLRKTTVFTIDGEDAKDLDDAISVSRTKSGYKLGVHIADVSHYVKPGSAIDEEAQLRGTSVYFADRVIPMLPKELSNGVCSLNAGEDKLTFSALIELDKTGKILSFQFRKSVIRSKVRGVYAEVNKIFDKTAGTELKKKYAPVIRSLNAARELAGVLEIRARERGTMDLESVESKFTLNDAGVCVDVRPRVSGEAEKLIEQLMITANQAAAMLAKEKGIPFVYRVHQQPDPERVGILVQLVGALGLDPGRIKKDSPKTRDFVSVLEQAKGTPAQKVVSHQILRTMEKARYSTEPTGHFGLALEDYCHFTSPIRRYPDTAIHRILSALASGKDKKTLSKEFSLYAEQAAADSSLCEVRAMTAERSAEDCYMAEYMLGHLGERFDGIISGVTMRGVFVELESSVEGFVPVESFEGADFHFDGMITQVDSKTGRRLTIGQPLRIQVAGADVASGKIDFVPAEEN